MTTYPIAVTVLVDDVEAYGGYDDLGAGRPTVLDGLSFTWGRDSIVDQPEAGSATLTIRQQIAFDTTPETSLFDVIHAGATIQIRAAGGGRDVLCWVGEITTVDVQQVSDFAIQANGSCVDVSALLSNITIGADPWPQQTAYDRFQAILTAAGLRLRDLHTTPDHWSWDITGQMDPTIQALQIARRDVDAQPPLDLIKALATSVGGVLWVTADDAGPYLWIEDPTQREGLKQFVIDPTTKIITIADVAFTDPDNPDLWSGADIIRDPVTWTQDPAQSITSVTVSWIQNLLNADREQNSTDDLGNPTNQILADETWTTNEMTVTRDDTDSIARFGVRSLSIDTELATMVDADRLAFNWLAQSRTSDWIVSGLSIDSAMLSRPTPGLTDQHRFDTIMDLLDVRTRIGYRLSIQDLPAWSPVGSRQSYYTEGGTYTWEGGRFKFDLTGSANAIGGGAIYEEFPPEPTWEDFDPSITWFDCYGVAAPEPVGA
jgi:hypothetical protein